MGLMQQNHIAEIERSFEDDSDRKVRRQMLIALTLLVGALILVLAKDRDFWFPSVPVAQSTSEPVEEVVPAPDSESEAASAPAQLVAATHIQAKPHTPMATSPAGPSVAATPAPATTTRTVLPPLQVEVVAGDEHRPVEGGTNSVKVDLQPGTSVSPAQAASTGVAQAADRVHLSPASAGFVSRPVEPNYPLLAKQMKVEGAVVMDALIGRDGNIQHLQILSGPKILSAAAREAVQQWRFRPFLQAGQAVETERRITVNFTIWTR
jgi:TonB family protein